MATDPKLARRSEDGFSGVFSGEIGAATQPAPGFEALLDLNDEFDIESLTFGSANNDRGLVSSSQPGSSTEDAIPSRSVQQCDDGAVRAVPNVDEAHVVHPTDENDGDAGGDQQSLGRAVRELSEQVCRQVEEVDHVLRESELVPTTEEEGEVLEASKTFTTLAEEVSRPSVGCYLYCHGPFNYVADCCLFDRVIHPSKDVDIRLLNSRFYRYHSLLGDEDGWEVICKYTPGCSRCQLCCKKNNLF